MSELPDRDEIRTARTTRGEAMDYPSYLHALSRVGIAYEDGDLKTRDEWYESEVVEIDEAGQWGTVSMEVDDEP